MKTFVRDLRWLLPASLIGSGLLTLAMPGGTWWIGWLAMTVFLFLGLWALGTLWRSVGASRTLGLILAIGLLLRLGTGVALLVLLPDYGYDTETQNAGYVFFDAFRRDGQAWELAQTEEPLWRAMEKSYSADQYGGLLALSALLYRYFSPDMQRPLLIVLVGAVVNIIGIVFAWKGAECIGGQRFASIVGWILALYPESVFLGSSQMREPFLMAFLAMIFWGFVDHVYSHQRRSWPWLVAGMLGLLLFSPAVALAVILVLGVWALLSIGLGGLRWWMVGATAGVILLAVILLALALEGSIQVQGGPLGTILTWMRDATRWDIYLLIRSSGWVGEMLERLPQFLHMPFIAGYGIVQPLLPAAITDPAIWLWRVIGVLRAGGWSMLLPFLVFAPFAGWQTTSREERRVWLWLALVTWAWILLSALRAGSDQWDNPRYRAIMLLFQAVLVARTWIIWRKTRNRWMNRILVVEGLFLLVFTYWYLDRKTAIETGNLHLMVILGVVIIMGTIVLVVGIIRDWSRGRRHTKRHRD
ncbi:MAG: hypothetical protein JXB85_06115 [Anaerolineales bacterium]|nr:hypothetical protein [Anaerolineales bacterium]